MSKFLLVLLFSISALYSTAQNITGKVTDDKGNAVSGASVQVKGTKRGTLTNENGIFILSVPSGGKTLIISSLNFTTTEVAVAANVSVSLKPASGTISEVVVVAYGTQKKTNVTGALTTVKASDIENKPFTSPDKSLQGAVAGLQVSSFSGAPGSSTDMLIRGIGSISGNTAPLWVIDGVIATTGDLTTETTTANALSGLNSDDIESITVLKDAASTAVYGSRAGNGVILVTTKKGHAGKTNVNFSSEIGANSIAFNPTNKPLNSIQSQKILRESLINAGYANNSAQADAIIIDPQNGLGIDSNYTQTNTNWRDVVTNSGAPQSQYNLSLNGGTEKTQVYASAGLFQQDGITIATNFKRYNGDVSVTHHVSDKLVFSADINGSSSIQNTPLNTGNFGNPVLASFFLLPWYTPYNTDGSLRYGDNDPKQEFPTDGGIFNPVVQAAFNKYQANTNTFRGNVSGEYKILDNLKFTSRFGAEYFDILEDQYLNPFYGDGQADNGDAYTNYRKTFDFTFSNYFDLKQKINKEGDIYFDFKGGFETQQTKDFYLQASGKSFPETLDLTYLASAGSPSGAYAKPDQSTFNSMFSVADINYKDKYVISGSFRRDGSSVFSVNKRWGNFFSVGGAWNVSEEDFLKNSKTINLLKIRASYGESGNLPGGFYSALPLYGYGLNYTGQPGSALTNVGNPDLTWEVNKPLDIGADISLWKDRLYATFDYYNRKTTALILSVPLSLTSGVSSQAQNVGSLSNKGYEISIGGRPVSVKDFTWDISFNIAHNTNRVLGLYNGVYNIPATLPYQVTVGHDVQEFYTRAWAGVDPATGSPLWYTDSTKTATTNNASAAPYILTGLSASPKYFGSVTNTFTYKGISLTTQIYYNFGNYVDQFYNSYVESEGAYLGSFNQVTEELTAWQKPGDVTNVPQIIFGGNDGSYRNSTRFYYNGSYVRLRNVQLGYAIPKTILTKLHIANASIYIRGTNLLTWVKDKTLLADPENGTASENNLDVYIPKTIAGGIKIGF